MSLVLPVKSHSCVCVLLKDMYHGAGLASSGSISRGRSFPNKKRHHNCLPTHSLCCSTERNVTLSSPLLSPSPR
uniref:Secreted protein n=1 Tax=Mesocestoides corti TaxID=53468 RepID=A0A5K3G2Q6_MESCO